ncbi:hypothetical protein BGZ60DRAFT_524248 [Tricladium varicosporioides]|nr:hypothetical protein BGZ60DRAFT_524248 [Hymenoscyphus varicosporioides]
MIPDHSYYTPTKNPGWILLQLVITLVILLLAAAVMAAIIITIFFLCNKYGSTNQSLNGKEVEEVKADRRRRENTEGGKAERLGRVERDLEKCLGRELEVKEGRIWGLESIWVGGSGGLKSSVGSNGSRGVQI